MLTLKDRAMTTGFIVPVEDLELAYDQVPKSVEILTPMADYVCKLVNPGTDSDIEISQEGETWESFRSNWIQTCAWRPGKQRNKDEGGERFGKLRRVGSADGLIDVTPKSDAMEATVAIMLEAVQDHAMNSFSLLMSTEENYRSDDKKFYGLYAHLRARLDYTYHSNYSRDRQFLQDTIIDEMLRAVKLKDVNGDVCTTPTEPWLVFTAGAMGRFFYYAFYMLTFNLVLCFSNALRIGFFSHVDRILYRCR